MNMAHDDAREPASSRPALPERRSGQGYRVLITDADYKNAIALARYIKRELPDTHLIGHSEGPVRYGKHYRCWDEWVVRKPLREVLETAAFDQVIPVGGRSTMEVARTAPTKAVIPGTRQLECCYDKRLTFEIARRIGIPTPTTQAVDAIGNLELAEVAYPCVVKPDRETVSAKAVRYCRSPEELVNTVGAMLEVLKRENAGVLVQEFIRGPGHGFFALADRGRPLRTFMHRRLRENPPSGGPSTAAGAFHSPRLEELGARFLAEIGWDGVAMVEFKFDEERRDFVLMETNGKFWGSLELALRSGVNFGADLIRLRRGEALGPQLPYDRDLRFYWPLDGDLTTLWAQRNWRGLGDYFKPGSATNVGQSLVADMVKSVRLLRDLLHVSKS